MDHAVSQTEARTLYKAFAHTFVVLPHSNQWCYKMHYDIKCVRILLTAKLKPGDMHVYT